jgi:UDP-glucose 4-epimerase
MKRICVVTGGCGFIGAYLVRKLIQLNWQVRVVDNCIRGEKSRLADVSNDINFFNCDIRDTSSLQLAFKSADVVFHLAAINGTENFYNQPELVLDVGIRGMLAVIDACRINNVPDLVVASSAEVYQTANIIPTDETVALTLPDSLNPRYSYGGSKILSELIAFNYGKQYFRKVQVFRPHNVYGPNMGWKHVIPQFITRALACKAQNKTEFSIQGSGNETRSFAYVDDVIDGIITMYEHGKHRNIYHIGNDQEVSIKNLVSMIAKTLNIELEIISNNIALGSVFRRCPDIKKIKNIGYKPQINLQQGIKFTCNWYMQNKNQNMLQNELL